MASTGWKEWKKKDMTADDVDTHPPTDDDASRSSTPPAAAPMDDPGRPAIADANGAFRRAVESTTDLVTFHARDGRVLFANRAGARGHRRRARRPAAAASTSTSSSTTTPEQLAEMRQSIIDFGRWSGELDVRGVDLRIPASVVVTGHRDANGRYEYFSALSRDITERRPIDAARRRSETALRSIVQSSPLPIFAVDAAGTVHVWNRACEELFGWIVVRGDRLASRRSSIRPRRSAR